MPEPATKIKSFDEFKLTLAELITASNPCEKYDSLVDYVAAMQNRAIDAEDNLMRVYDKLERAEQQLANPDDK